MRQPFLRRASSYDELWSQMDYRTLDIPERFNLGVACVDEQDPSAVALTVVAPDDSHRSYTFGDVKDQANRLANVLNGPRDRQGRRGRAGEARLAGDGRRLHGHLPDGCRRPAHVVAVRPRRARLPPRATATPRRSSARPRTRRRSERRSAAPTSPVIVVGGDVQPGEYAYEEVLAGGERRLRAGVHPPGGPGVPHLHVRHHGRPEGRPARPSHRLRPDPRLPGRLRVLPAARRRLLVARRLGVDRRPHGHPRSRPGSTACPSSSTSRAASAPSGRCG